MPPASIRAKPDSPSAQVSTAKPRRARGRRARQDYARPGPLAAESPQTHGLFEALRTWRKAQARLQSVPPYVIFHDRTLLEIAQTRPPDLARLGAVNGGGVGKLERYGAGVLEVVRDAAG